MFFFCTVLFVNMLTEISVISNYFLFNKLSVESLCCRPFIECVIDLILRVEFRNIMFLQNVVLKEKIFY